MSSRAAIKRRRLGAPVLLCVGELQLNLCFDFNAIALIEERAGVGVLNGEIWEVLNPSEAVSGKSPAKVLAVALWAASLAYQPELDSDEGFRVLCSHVGFDDAPRIAEALSEAFIAALPKDQQDKIHAQRPEADAQMRPLEQPETMAGSTSGPLPEGISGSPMKSSAA